MGSGLSCTKDNDAIANDRESTTNSTPATSRTDPGDISVTSRRLTGEPADFTGANSHSSATNDAFAPEGETSFTSTSSSSFEHQRQRSLNKGCNPLAPPVGRQQQQGCFYGVVEGSGTAQNSSKRRSSSSGRGASSQAPKKGRNHTVVLQARSYGNIQTTDNSPCTSGSNQPTTLHGKPTAVALKDASINLLKQHHHQAASVSSSPAPPPPLRPLQPSTVVTASDPSPLSQQTCRSSTSSSSLSPTTTNKMMMGFHQQQQQQPSTPATTPIGRVHNMNGVARCSISRTGSASPMTECGGGDESIASGLQSIYALAHPPVKGNVSGNQSLANSDSSLLTTYWSQTQWGSGGADDNAHAMGVMTGFQTWQLHDDEDDE